MYHNIVTNKRAQAVTLKTKDAAALFHWQFQEWERISGNCWVIWWESKSAYDRKRPDNNADGKGNYTPLVKCI